MIEGAGAATGGGDTGGTTITGLGTGATEAKQSSIVKCARFAALVVHRIFAAATLLLSNSANCCAVALESHPLSVRDPPKLMPPGMDCAPAPNATMQGAVAKPTGAKAVADAGLMLVMLVLSFALSPLPVAVEALLFVEEFDCFWLWLPPCSVLLFVFELLPLLLTPDEELELPPVAVLDALPPVALLVLFDAEVALFVFVFTAPGGALVAVGNVSQMKVRPLSTTTCPGPSPVPLPNVPLGTWTLT